MSSPDSLRWLKLPVFLNHGVAVLSVIAALFIARWMQIQYDFEPLTPFLCAVMLSALLGGIKPGLLALALCLLAFHYYFLIPIYPLGMDKEIPRLLLAALMGLFIVSLGAAQRGAAEALRESELRFRQIAENIQDIFRMSNRAMDQVLYISPAYEKIWGRSLASVRRQPRSFFDAIHDDDRAAAVKSIEAGRETGFNIEYRVVRPDGTLRWIRDRGFPVKDGSGKVYRIAGISEDITERRQVNEALRQSEFDLAEAQRAARMGSWTYDIASDTVRWSEELYRIFDVDKAAFGGAYEIFIARVHPDDRARVLQVNADARASGKPFEVEYRIKTRSDQLKHIGEVGYAKKDARGAVSGLFGTAQDITEQKHAENSLRDSSVQLRALSRRLVDLQESERRQLARELHDRVGQSLTALRINLDILRTELVARGIDAVRSRLDDSAALLESMIDTIVNVSSELRPPMLDDHGLAAALDWYARSYSTRTGITVAVRAGEPATRPPPKVEIALYRIAQEAINNVAKHARAQRVEITLDHANGECVMAVQDDGIGFAGEVGASDKPGLGIVTMRERAEAVGGRFEVRALPGRGTRLTVSVPY